MYFHYKSETLIKSKLQNCKMYIRISLNITIHWGIIPKHNITKPNLYHFQMCIYLSTFPQKFGNSAYTGLPNFCAQNHIYFTIQYL